MKENGQRRRPDMKSTAIRQSQETDRTTHDGMTNGRRHSRPKGPERRDLWWIASQPSPTSVLAEIESIVNSFPPEVVESQTSQQEVAAIESPRHGEELPTAVSVAPITNEAILEVSDGTQKTDVYTQAYLPSMEPPAIPESSKRPRIPVKLSFFRPDATQQPEFQAFAKQYWGPSNLMAMEAIAHLESPVKNGRSQIFLDREKRKKERYLASHPQVPEAEYDEMRKRQWEQMKKRTQIRGVKNFYREIENEFPITGEKTPIYVSRHLGHGTNAVEGIHRTVFSYEESPLKNENQLPSITPWRDTMAILSPNVDRKLQEQAKTIYLTAHESATIEATNPKDLAGKKLSLIQALFDKKLFEGLTGQTHDVTVKGVFSRGENLLLGVEGATDGISTTNLQQGQRVKERTLPMRVMQDTGILMYTNANAKDPTSGISKAFKKAVLRANKPDGREDLDSINDVTDTYRIKFAVMGGEQEVDTVMYKVLEILTDPNNKDDLRARDEYEQPVGGDIGATVIKKWEDDSMTNGTSDQADDVIFRNRVQIYFADLHHPVEIMFQTMEEFFRSEYNVGHYDDAKGKFTGAAHKLYEIARAKLIAGVLFDKSIYTDPKHQDLDGSAKKAMEIAAQELRKQDVVATSQA